MGNVPMHLHDWECRLRVLVLLYKYLNSGPGAVAGAFVHDTHVSQRRYPSDFDGWWGHDRQASVLDGT